MIGLLSVGSPPRVREKRATRLSHSSFFRITPACAGKTKGVYHLPTDHRDHPRVCGKNFSLCYQHTGLVGSPPRVREKQFCIVQDLTSSGITPACAGKTVIVVRPHISVRDHPRVCGKNLILSALLLLGLGSPPRVREKRE